jgi:hypothetical protein
LKVLWGEGQGIEALHGGCCTDDPAIKQIHLASGEGAALGGPGKAGFLKLQQPLLPLPQLMLLKWQRFRAEGTGPDRGAE